MRISKGSQISALIDSMEGDPLSDEQKRAAALIVCGNAKGDTHEEQVADARELIFMLGLHPSQKDEEYLTNPLRENRMVS